MLSPTSLPHQCEIAAKAFIYQGSRFLLQLRDDMPEIPYPNHWGLFGGLVDPGESSKNAIKRELLEELGWEPPEVHFLTAWEGAHDPCVNHIFIVPLTIDINQLTLTEGQALGLFNLEELTKLRLVPKISFLLPQVVKAIALPELTLAWDSLPK